MPDSARPEHDMTGCTSCALPAEEREDRVEAWRAITAEAHDHAHETGRLVSRYPGRPGIADRLRELVAAEGECCPFLTFELSENDSGVRLEMRYPPEFRDMVTYTLTGDVPR